MNNQLWKGRTYMVLDRKALIEEIKENERVIGNPVKVGEYTLVPIIEIGTSFIKGVLGVEVILEASVSPKSIVFIKEDKEIGILHIDSNETNRQKQANR